MRDREESQSGNSYYWRSMQVWNSEEIDPRVMGNHPTERTRQYPNEVR